MKQIGIVVLVILWLLVTGCSNENNAPDGSESIQEKNSIQSITEADIAEVREIMTVAFVKKDIDGALENSFKDLANLRRIQEAVDADSLKETKNILISKYKASPMSENRGDFLNRFQADTIEVYEESDRIYATIDIRINGDMQPTKHIFVLNEEGEWFNMEELLILARELKIEL